MLASLLSSGALQACPDAEPNLWPFATALITPVRLKSTVVLNVTALKVPVKFGDAVSARVGSEP